MKSAYEAALERLEESGIDRPREEGLDAAVRERIAEARRKADARLAELEILHRDRRKELSGEERREEEKEYRDEVRRIRDGLEREVAALRGE